MSIKREWDKNPNMLVPYYLMFSFLYYKKDISLIDDTEYEIPYQKDDYFVIFVKISGNIDLEERTSETTGEHSNYNILKNLYSSNIYLTFNDASQNIKTNQSIWRLIIQLA